MVGYDPEKKTLTKVGYSGAGAASGIITRMVCQPLDVLKIRFQLQIEPIERKSTSKYSGVIQAATKIFKDEQMVAFWKGHMPAQMLSMVYGTVQFASFEIITKYVWHILPLYLTQDLKPVTHFTCGCLSGCLATVAAQPFDVIRTRFVAQGNKKMYTSMYSATSIIVRTEGVRGLYRGLLPTLLQITPQTGFQFGFYAMFKKILRTLTNKEEKDQGFVLSFISGAGAGVCAKTAVYPLDMVKKRLQVVGFEHGRVGFGKNQLYQGLKHCVLTVVREEGVTGLYKGLLPSLYKACLSVGLHFSVYDYICRTIIYHQK